MKLVRVFLAALILTGCAEFDKSSVRAKSGAPDSVAIPEFSIAFDQSVPLYVVATEPISFKNSTSEFNSDLKGNVGKRKIDLAYQSTWGWEALAPRANQISAQLISALSQVENFQVLSTEAVKKLDGGRYESKLGQGEKGPYIFKALITEYEARVEEDSRRTHAVIYDEGERLASGVVALDVQIIDGRTGRIVSGFPVRATFSSKKTNSGSGLIPIYKEEFFAQSVTDQALRVALNEAAQKGFEALKVKVTK